MVLLYAELAASDAGGQRGGVVPAPVQERRVSRLLDAEPGHDGILSRMNYVLMRAASEEEAYCFIVAAPFLSRTQNSGPRICKSKINNDE
mmetsp:Transcript_5465/g.11880  ORF Transcript_5465/g.11880 Transcript_5465/m.11880 type:complete len:90 (-) Transcript_5465:129-398(-)